MPSPNNAFPNYALDPPLLLFIIYMLCNTLENYRWPLYYLNEHKIFLVSELGSGQFGIVWLAEAVGISAFNPRDILREREGGRRFSLFHRTAKRNSYVYCKQVTNVAVKKLKGLTTYKIQR